MEERTVRPSVSSLHGGKNSQALCQQPAWRKEQSGLATAACMEERTARPCVSSLLEERTVRPSVNSLHGGKNSQPSVRSLHRTD